MTANKIENCLVDQSRHRVPIARFGEQQFLVQVAPAMQPEDRGGTRESNRRRRSACGHAKRSSQGDVRPTLRRRTAARTWKSALSAVVSGEGFADHRQGDFTGVALCGEPSGRPDAIGDLYHGTPLTPCGRTLGRRSDPHFRK